jgi:hypothetical protein
MPDLEFATWDEIMEEISKREHPSDWVLLKHNQKGEIAIYSSPQQTDTHSVQLCLTYISHFMDYLEHLRGK